METEVMRNSHIKVGSWQLAVGSRPMGVSANRQLPTANCFAGFTAVELLTVMIIITLLLAILIPAVAKIRRGAYIANTQNEMDQISSACNRYFDVFNAYPGPVSNSDIESQFYMTPASPTINTSPVNGNAITSGPTPIYQSNASASTPVTTLPPGNPNPNPGFFTASENLVLGLVGGLWVDPYQNDPNYYPKLAKPGVEFVNSTLPGATITTLIGAGPQSLVLSQFSTGAANSYSANPSFKQYDAFLPVTFPGSPLMMNGDGSFETGQYHDAGGRTFNDCVIPVFTDAFPDHMPILYIRARVGAHGIISGPDTGNNAVMDPTQGNNVVAHYNYDLVEILPYTMNKTATQAFAGVSPNGGGMQALPGQHGLQSVSSKTVEEPDYAAFSGTLPSTWNHNVPTNDPGNAGQYFMNPAAPPENMKSAPIAEYENATGTPRQKDTYILISAGADRTYGTGDDLTNFGNVGQ
jgi:type II secretory pathway pseudopilin PulG